MEPDTAIAAADFDVNLDEAPVEVPIPWKPMYDKLIVRRDKPKQQHGEKIVVAEAYEQAQNKGTVLAVGEGRLILSTGAIVPLKVKPGMRVCFGKHSGIELDEHKDVVILREDELLGYAE